MQPGVLKLDMALMTHFKKADMQRRLSRLSYKWRVPLFCERNISEELRFVYLDK